MGRFVIGRLWDVIWRFLEIIGGDLGGTVKVLVILGVLRVVVYWN